MLIIDTSIWIEFFKVNDPYFNIVREHLEKNNVIALEVIFSELIQGCKNSKEVNIIQEYWKNLEKFSEENLMLEAAKLSYSNKFIDKGVGLIDSVIIYASYKLKCKIWKINKKILSVLNDENKFSP